MNPAFLNHASKKKNSELESLINRHLDKKKDKRRRSLGKHFHKAANKLHHESSNKHRRNQSNPGVKTGNFIQNFRSSRAKANNSR